MPKFNVQEYYGPEPFTALAHPLTKMAGSFTYSGKVWPNEEDLSEEVGTSGKAEARLLVDGRFLQIEWEGDALGDRWCGVHLLGYDSGHSSPEGQRGLKEVHFNRYGNFGAGKCSYDGTSTVLDIHGQTDECSRGVEQYRSVFTLVDDNSFKLEVYMTGKDGNESKAREFTFTRV